MMKKLKTLKKKIRKNLIACFPGLKTEMEKLRDQAEFLLSPEEIFTDGEISFASDQEYEERIEDLLKKYLQRGY